MKVVEIFESIQGEGDHMGEWVTFVRFAGCNLQCPWCDEHYKYDKAVEMSIDVIVSSIKTHHVVLTGGEPTIQPGLMSLCAALHDAGKIIHIETNGTGSVPYLVDWVTVSPKGPDFNVTQLYAQEIKLVVDADLTWDKVCEILVKFSHTGHVWLQPCDGPYLEESKKKIGQWVKEHGNSDVPNLRAGIQLHKYYGLV